MEQCMPSKALEKFETKLLKDVERLIHSHGTLNHAGKGRRGLGHITRSAVFMLCAAWERYIEDLLIEAVQWIIEQVPGVKSLPKIPQKDLASYVKKHKNELKVLELSGEGWKNVYKNHVTELSEKLNTPKAEIIDALFEKSLGVTLSKEWSMSPVEINRFVTLRGDIAHNGCDAKYVTIDSLSNYKGYIQRTVLETDNFMANYLKGLSSTNKQPWRRRRQS